MVGAHVPWERQNNPMLKAMVMPGQTGCVEGDKAPAYGGTGSAWWADGLRCYGSRAVAGCIAWHVYSSHYYKHSLLALPVFVYP